MGVANSKIEFSLKILSSKFNTNLAERLKAHAWKTFILELRQNFQKIFFLSPPPTHFEQDCLLYTVQ